MRDGGYEKRRREERESGAEEWEERRGESKSGAEE